MAKNRRKKHRRYLETPKVTPSHFIRLERLKVVIDESRKWYVVRVNAKTEVKVQRGLEQAGFTTYRPVDTDMVRRRGRVYEVGKRPAAGYLFVGVTPDKCGHEELWAYHDRIVAGDQPFTVIDQEGRELVCDARMVQERPFYRVMGPFGVKQLQRFADRIRPPLVAALWYKGEVLGHFPAIHSGLVEGEKLLLTNVFEKLETLAA
ncbi:transcription termination/antitermination NusG family protein [Microvirga arsenatis]|uniref:Antitermination protein NusG n=1 Tax=Microvirga arsenatis TaxID=2692265 RepID=A0ABW9YWA8_9HYPH|nr:transcription termination/antitermination NusG family protein [Microvirga arsenatis]NBJ13323.1 antitermination protein NusG [Microvirga arsenatis]NBJ24107.1 antitermination protein NusG [Microvirga arsenatis]